MILRIAGSAYGYFMQPGKPFPHTIDKEGSPEAVVFMSLKGVDAQRHINV